jgi:hypothetical protein
MFVCYRFPDQETFLTLAAAEGLGQDGQLITGGHGWALDPIGDLDEGDAVYDPETGELITPATPIPGYHVNTWSLAPEAWSEYRIQVNSASRVFMGKPSVSLLA